MISVPILIVLLWTILATPCIYFDLIDFDYYESEKFGLWFDYVKLTLVK